MFKKQKDNNYVYTVIILFSKSTNPLKYNSNTPKCYLCVLVH